MDGFFDKYGRMIIIAVAICFVLLYLTPMRNVVGSSINGFAGNFANKVGESLGTVKMPDGSDKVAKEKSSTIIGTVESGESAMDTQFANAIPEAATTVVFTDEVAPEGTVTTDLTVAKDGDVVGWLDGTTWKISTQDSNKAVTFNGNCAGMFAVFYGEGKNKLERLTEISFDNVDTSNVTKMNLMFYGCANLTALNLNNFDTSKVADMNGMFANCTNLTSLNVSNFNTSKVTDMEMMFGGCENLHELDLSNFDTSNSTNMETMFYGCSNLTNIYVGPKWSTKKVTKGEGMFDHCKKLPNYNNASVPDVTKAHTGPGGYLTLKA